MGLFSKLFSHSGFRPDFSKTEYDNWLNFLDNGGTSEEWEAIKKKNSWRFKDDCVEEPKKPKTVHLETPAPIINCPGRTIPLNLKAGIISVSISDRKIIDKEFEQINKLITHALKLAHLNKHLKIDTTCFLYAHNYTYYEGKPLTPSGRASKIPLTLHYAYGSHYKANPSQDFFGEVGYSQDGRIAKARLIFWRKKDGYMIHLGIVNKALVVKKVELNVDSGWKVVYKL